MNITENITIDIAKKILGNIEWASFFLLDLNERLVLRLPTRIVIRGKNKGDLKGIMQTVL